MPRTPSRESEQLPALTLFRDLSKAEKLDLALNSHTRRVSSINLGNRLGGKVAAPGAFEQLSEDELEAYAHEEYRNIMVC